MNESTQEGDSTVEADVDSVAEAIYSEPVESTSTEAEALPEEETAESVDTDETGESETLESDAPETEAETFQTLQELAEATGMDYQEFLKTIKATTKVDGEESEVPLADVLKGHQLEKHFTLKNEAFLAEQQQWQEQQQQQQAQIQQQLQRAGVVFQNAQQQLTHEFNAINWEQLKADNPTEFVVKQHEFGQRQAELDRQVNEATRYAQQVQQQQQAEKQTQLAKYQEEQGKMLLNAIPEWSNPETRKQETEQLTQFLMQSGYTAEEIGGIYDHRIVLMARNAMKGVQQVDALKVAEKAVRKAPKLSKSKARQSKPQRDLSIEEVFYGAN